MKNRSLLRCLLYGLVLSACNDDPRTARIGLEDPVFQSVSENWISPYFQLDMTEILTFNGINRSGRNYYFLSKPDAFTCSSRFVPSSEYFQSWIGMYTVDDNQQGTYALGSEGMDSEAIFELAIADQKAWLNAFGLQDPSVYIDESVPVSETPMMIDGIEGWRLDGRLISNVDVGLNNPETNENLINIETSYWSNEIESYQNVKLDVSAFVWYSPENEELNVAYFNLTEFESKSGLTVRNDEIRAELENMIRSITVYEERP